MEVRCRSVRGDGGFAHRHPQESELATAKTAALPTAGAEPELATAT
jgi:hypothetical protein